MFDEHMLIPFELSRTRLRRLDGVRRSRYVEEVRTKYAAWVAGHIPLHALCSHAGDALERCAAETLHALLSEAAGGTEFDTAASWVLQDYNESIAIVGAALRDVIDDSTARHAVAQTLQERVLLAELNFRRVLHPPSAAEPGV